MVEAIKLVVSEHTSNVVRMWQMAKDHMTKQTIRTSLGVGWIFIRDIIYFGVFTLFRYLMSGGALVDGMNFAVYLITGLVPWFFINEVINGGSNAILTNKAIIRSIRFPITIIPTTEVIAIFLKRIFSMLIAFVVVIIFGYIGRFNLFLFLYYFIVMFIFCVALNLITSGLVAISDDFKQFYMAVTRIIFFSMPIIWSFEKVNDIHWLKYILKLNPMTYIIMGFRDAFFHGNMPDLEYSIYFFAVLIIMYMAGIYTQFKLRKYYADFM